MTKSDIRDRPVPVDGAVLNVAEYGPSDGPVVLAIHGITASSRSWLALARLLPDARIVAPDLRGRARSNRAEGPYSLYTLRDDLQHVLDTLDLGPVVVVGHSMGAFVAALLAAAEPRRVAEAVLVDGGFPLALPAGLTREALAALSPAALLGPAFDRLTRIFPTREAYRDFWRAHPAFAADWTDDVAAYADYDLEPADGGFRPSANPAAVAEVQPELYGDDLFRRLLTRIPQPTTVLRAPLGLQAEPPGLYAPGVLNTFTADVPQLAVIEVPDVNHYTVLMTRPGVDAVADVVQRAVTRLPSPA